jgi:hypothetical protein
MPPFRPASRRSAVTADPKCPCGQPGVPERSAPAPPVPVRPRAHFRCGDPSDQRRRLDVLLGRGRQHDDGGATRGPGAGGRSAGGDSPGPRAHAQHRPLRPVHHAHEPTGGGGHGGGHGHRDTPAVRAGHPAPLGAGKSDGAGRRATRPQLVVDVCLSMGRRDLHRVPRIGADRPRALTKLAARSGPACELWLTAGREKMDAVLGRMKRRCLPAPSN